MYMTFVRKASMNLHISLIFISSKPDHETMESCTCTFIIFYHHLLHFLKDKFIKILIS